MDTTIAQSILDELAAIEAEKQNIGERERQIEEMKSEVRLSKSALWTRAYDIRMKIRLNAQARLKGTEGLSYNGTRAESLAEWHDDAGNYHRIYYVYTFHPQVVSVKYPANARPSGRNSTQDLHKTPLEHLQEHFGPLFDEPRSPL